MIQYYTIRTEKMQDCFCIILLWEKTFSDMPRISEFRRNIIGRSSNRKRENFPVNVFGKTNLHFSDLQDHVFLILQKNFRADSFANSRGFQKLSFFAADTYFPEKDRLLFFKKIYALHLFFRSFGKVKKIQKISKKVLTFQKLSDKIVCVPS